LAEATGDSEFARDLFARHIEGREPLDYSALLAAAGLQLRKLSAGKAWIGPDHFETVAEGVKIAQGTLFGSPLYVAGLEEGDEISQCDGKKIKKTEDLLGCVAKHVPGDRLTLDYLSRAGRKRAIIRVAEDPNLELVTYEKTGLQADARIRSFREAWLGSKALHLRTTEPVVIW
jgi:predicted metalloprotease with PDZ domain